eukprot:SAG31_NODE_6_length_43291_cov_191.503496_2_plen_1028_part_00
MDLHRLTTLDVHGCALTGVGNLRSWNSLKVLELSNNSFKSLPMDLPQQLTHLYLGSNPLRNSALELSELTQRLPNLAALDIAFLGLGVDLSSSEVALPAGCRLGSNPPPCTLTLHLCDDESEPIKVGDLMPGLALGLIGSQERVTMKDNGDGSYSADLPGSWAPKRTSETLSLSLFNGGMEFSLSGRDKLRVVRYGPAVCPTSLHTSVNTTTGATCVCDDGFEPDEANDAADQNGTLVCHRSCLGIGEEPDSSGGGCRCHSGLYNSTEAGVLVCVKNAWSSAVVPQSIDPGAECQPCPTECATCDDDGIATIADGWRLNVSETDQIRSQLTNDRRWLFAFLCQDQVVCPRIELSLSNIERNASQAQCANNMTGWLCGSCADHYSRTPTANAKMSCTSCKDLDALHAIRVDRAIFVVGVLVVLGLGCKVLSWLVSEHNTFLYPVQIIWREVSTNAKILIGLAQVLSLLSGVLDLLFPHPEVMETLSLATANLNQLFRFECLDFFDFYVRWTISVVGVPSLATTAIGGRWLWQRYRGVDLGEARQTAVQASFFVAMVIYPKVSNEIFRLLPCRSLGQKLAVLQSDYSVDCMSTHYSRYHAVAIALVVIVPIGMPLVLLILLLCSHRNQSAVDRRTSADDVADRVSHSSPHDSFATGAVNARYRTLYATFAFCISDYRPSCYWYEPVDLLRKLTLTSLLTFIHRGSAMQTLCGCGIAVGSLVMQVYLNPYRNRGANLLKALVDAQILFTFLISFVLRVLSANEVRYMYDFYAPFAMPTAAVEVYGWLLVGSMIVVVSVGVGLTINELVRNHSRTKINKDYINAATGFELSELDVSELDGDERSRLSRLRRVWGNSVSYGSQPMRERDEVRWWRYSSLARNVAGGDLPEIAILRRSDAVLRRSLAQFDEPPEVEEGQMLDFEPVNESQPMPEESGARQRRQQDDEMEDDDPTSRLAAADLLEQFEQQVLEDNTLPSAEDSITVWSTPANQQAPTKDAELSLQTIIDVVDQNDDNDMRAISAIAPGPEGDNP